MYPNLTWRHPAAKPSSKDASDDTLKSNVLVTLLL